ncbi:hypothetical protein [Enhydrobacter sp.]|uniref:hypothetical protein n=1 Tax=Enhydrobacter sp. TaxID=1894999 RepID=UPI00261BE844|nr:hypothetical protein [Enhydrobacter sp.]
MVDRLRQTRVKSTFRDDEGLANAVAARRHRLEITPCEIPGDLIMLRRQCRISTVRAMGGGNHARGKEQRCSGTYPGSDMHLALECRVPNDLGPMVDEQTRGRNRIDD